MARRLAFHNAHFPIDVCRKLVQRLRRSGKYFSVSIGSPMVANGTRYGKVFVEPFGAQQFEVVPNSSGINREIMRHWR